MSPTINQLARKGRKSKRRRCTVPALVGGPHKRGIIYRLAITTPRKPNSARRRIAKVRILGVWRNLRAFATIPGIGPHGLNEFSVVLLEGGGPKDTPGVNYSLLRGVMDFDQEEVFGRKNRRSKFGVLKPIFEVVIRKKDEDEDG